MRTFAKFALLWMIALRSNRVKTKFEAKFQKLSMTSTGLKHPYFNNKM